MRAHGMAGQIKKQTETPEYQMERISKKEKEEEKAPAKACVQIIIIVLLNILISKHIKYKKNRNVVHTSTSTD